MKSRILIMALLAASIKSPEVLTRLIACGAAAVTLPPASLMAWAGDHGRFVFLDADHAEHDAWPPPLAKKPAQLPLAVRLEGRRDGQPWALFAHLPGPDQPRPRVRDLFGNPAR